MERTTPSPERPGGSIGNGRRTYHPSCFSSFATITNIDLDITKKCNLRCIYCFKGELAGMSRKTMPLDVARAAVDWMIDNSGNVDYLDVNLLGGEPTLAWHDTIVQLVPYAKRRGFARGKTVQFGTTTNLVAVTPEIVDFSARWGMGWHLSIDGMPEVQIAQRLDGRSHLMERIENAARLILRYRPGFCARATFTPPYFDRLFASYVYLMELGFSTFGFATSTQTYTEDEIRTWVEQSELIVDDVLARASRGQFLDNGLVTYMFKSLAGGPPPGSCGAGRGYVMIDQEGDIWPCHRWDGAAHDTGQEDRWCLGNIFSGTFDSNLHRVLLEREEKVVSERCAECDARQLCGHGCPAENLSEAGSLAAPLESQCELMLQISEMATRKYDECIKNGNRNIHRFIDSLSDQLPNRPSAAVSP